MYDPKAANASVTPLTSTSGTGTTNNGTTTTTTPKTNEPLPEWAIITISVTSAVVAVAIAVVVAVVVLTPAAPAAGAAAGAGFTKVETRNLIRCALLDNCDDSKQTSIQTLTSSLGDDLNSYVLSMIADAYDELMEMATAQAILI